MATDEDWPVPRVDFVGDTFRIGADGQADENYGFSFYIGDDCVVITVIWDGEERMQVKLSTDEVAALLERARRDPGAS
jgi:hypothetical protein